MAGMQGISNIQVLGRSLPSSLDIPCWRLDIQASCLLPRLSAGSPLHYDILYLCILYPDRLTFIEGFIETIQFNQFPVGSVLHQLALIEYQNPIGLL